MVGKFSSLNSEFLERWYKAVQIYGIPKEAYKPEVKIVKDKIKGEFSFGIILNNYRFQRYEQPGNSCFLCDVVDISDKEQIMNLDPESKLKGFRVIPNKYPLLPGTSVAISTEERPMYTDDLDHLPQELSNLIRFTNATGFRFFHNGPGAGASIPGHEHYHLTNFGVAYDLAGEIYGFDSKKNYQDIISNDIFINYNFPFFHLIFNQKAQDRLVFFLKQLNKKLGSNFPNKVVPHGIAEIESGILVVPVKNYQDKGIGSGDMAGHLVVKTRKDFERADYGWCITKLQERLYTQEELNLERFL